MVREGKGEKPVPSFVEGDRVTTLAGAVRGPLGKHLERVRRLHERDLKAGLGRVPLPEALAVKYPNADREWGWQWASSSLRCRRPTGRSRTVRRSSCAQCRHTETFLSVVSARNCAVKSLASTTRSGRMMAISSAAASRPRRSFTWASWRFSLCGVSSARSARSRRRVIIGCLSDSASTFARRCRPQNHTRRGKASAAMDLAELTGCSGRGQVSLATGSPRR